MLFKAGFMPLTRICIALRGRFCYNNVNSANKKGFFVVLLEGGLMPDDFCTNDNTPFSSCQYLYRT
jgi:hypothetical protein